MRPPRFATWLLLALGTGPDVDVIAGDLLEAYASRSRIWYWRQVLWAIAVGAAHDVRQHWLLALRAVFIGNIALRAASIVAHAFGYWVLPKVLPPPINPWSWPVLLLIFGLPAAVAGWLVARLHARHAVAFVTSFTLVALLFELLPRFTFLVRNSFEHERFRPYLWAYLAGAPVMIGVIVAGVIVGAMLAQPTRHLSSPPTR
jgi:hypothetical protein